MKQAALTKKYGVSVASISYIKRKQNSKNDLADVRIQKPTASVGLTRRLTAIDHAEILSLLDAGVKPTVVAKGYGVSVATISYIKRTKSIEK